MENINRLTSNDAASPPDYYLYNKRVQANVEPVDAILVEASPDQVASLLLELDRDAESFVRIAVDDQQLADPKADASMLAGIDWSWFDRGPDPVNLRSGQRAATANRANGFGGGGDSFDELDATEPLVVGGARGGRGGRRRGRARSANRGDAAGAQAQAGQSSEQELNRGGGRAEMGRELNEPSDEGRLQSTIPGRARRVRWNALTAAPESNAAPRQERGVQTSTSDLQSRLSAGTSEQSSAELADRIAAPSGSVDRPSAAEPARTPSRSEPLRVLFVLSVSAETGTPAVENPVQAGRPTATTSPPPSDREK
jgi:hypothetical protein